MQLILFRLIYVKYYVSGLFSSGHPLARLAFTYRGFGGKRVGVVHGGNSDECKKFYHEILLAFYFLTMLPVVVSSGGGHSGGSGESKIC